jgi:hypothetical protein
MPSYLFNSIFHNFPVNDRIDIKHRYTTLEICQDVILFFSGLQQASPP